jgi:hypothetical protein
MNFIRTLVSAATAGFVLLLANSASATDVVYDFTGDCRDCTGTSSGVLTLTSDYTLDDALTTSNFISFTYTSNLISSLTIANSDLQDISGSISTIPGVNYVIIDTPTTTFQSYLSYFWCIGDFDCGEDDGDNFSWTLGSAGSGGATGGAVPEPGTWTLIIAGVGLVGAGSRAVRRRPSIAV